MARAACSLSLALSLSLSLSQSMVGAGVVCDLRRPDMLRFAPAPLYNTFEETHTFALLLREALTAVASS